MDTKRETSCPRESSSPRIRHSSGTHITPARCRNVKKAALPSPIANLPSPKSALPSPIADLPSPIATLPSAAISPSITTSHSEYCHNYLKQTESSALRRTHSFRTSKPKPHGSPLLHRTDGSPRRSNSVRATSTPLRASPLMGSKHPVRSTSPLCDNTTPRTNSPIRSPSSTLRSSSPQSSVSSTLRSNSPLSYNSTPSSKYTHISNSPLTDNPPHRSSSPLSSTATYNSRRIPNSPQRTNSLRQSKHRHRPVKHTPDTGVDHPVATSAISTEHDVIPDVRAIRSVTAAVERIEQLSTRVTRSEVRRASVTVATSDQYCSDSLPASVLDRDTDIDKVVGESSRTFRTNVASSADSISRLGNESPPTANTPYDGNVSSNFSADDTNNNNASIGYKQSPVYNELSDIKVTRPQSNIQDVKAYESDEKADEIAKENNVEIAPDVKRSYDDLDDSTFTIDDSPHQQAVITLRVDFPRVKPLVEADSISGARSGSRSPKRNDERGVLCNANGHVMKTSSPVQRRRDGLPSPVLGRKDTTSMSPKSYRTLSSPKTVRVPPVIQESSEIEPGNPGEHVNDGVCDIPVTVPSILVDDGDLDKMKETARRMRLKTTRPSYVAWKRRFSHGTQTFDSTSYFG